MAHQPTRQGRPPEVEDDDPQVDAYYRWLSEVAETTTSLDESDDDPDAPETPPGR